MTRRDLHRLCLFGALAGAAGPAAASTGSASSDPPSNPQDLETRCRREVDELHRFFEDWFLARLPDTDDAFDRFPSVMDDGFIIISPSGRMLRRDPLTENLRGAHGAWKNSDGAKKIWIENFQLHRTVGDAALVTYEEWQQRGDAPRGRLSSALFGLHPGTANGVAWLHLHEVWLPQA